jgi:hypothetical protein
MCYRSDLPVFLCERCGWAHICDDTCKERIVDAATDMLVCPISGFCSGRLLTEDEVRLQSFCVCLITLLCAVEMTCVK